MSSHENKSSYSYDFPSSPEKFGPGLWLTIHIMALNATSKDKMLYFIENIKLIASKVPCGKCKKHFLKYINENPPDNYINYPNDMGMFFWSWKFHNKVNKFLNKPIMEFEMALDIYSDDEIIPCEKSCNSDKIILGKLGEKKMVPTYGSRIKKQNISN